MSISFEKESKLLAKHSVIYGTGSFLNQAAGFLLLPLYTRLLTTNDYGIKELIGLSTDVIGILVVTAIASGIYRFYFEYDDEKERNEVISTAIIAMGGFGLLVIAVLVIFSKPLATLILDNSALYYYLEISFASMWFTGLNNIGYNYLRANRQSLMFVTLSSTKFILAICLNIYLVGVMKLGVLGILISTLVTSILLSMSLIAPLMYKIKAKFSLKKFLEMVKFSIPLVPSQMGAFVVHLSNRFFIRGLCSMGDVGLYSLGYRFGSLPQTFITGPFNQIWMPRRMELYKKQGAERIFGRIFTYFLALIVFVGLGISVLTENVLRIIADERFWGAHRIVPIIALSVIVFSLHYHFNIGILIKKKTKYLAYVNFSNGILILALNFILIRRFGFFGAAYATLIAFVYKVVLTYYFSSKYYRIHFEFGRIARLILCASLLYVLCLKLTIDSIYISFLAKTGIVFFYPVLLFLMRFYSTEEKQKVAYLVRKYVFRT